MIKKIFSALKRFVYWPPDKWEKHFLTECSGILHVGASNGSEASNYAKYGKPVIWIEAIPSVFQKLKESIGAYPGQLAFQGLVSDTAGIKTKFQVSEEGGAQSSLFRAAPKMNELFPHVRFTHTIELTTTTIYSLMHDHGLTKLGLNYLILDVQGAELLALRGMKKVLEQFDYLKVEASKVTIYEQGVLWPRLSSFLRGKGFRPVQRLPRGCLHGDTLWIRTSKKNRI